MNISQEHEVLLLRQKLIKEIKYRQEILCQLRIDSNKEKGFVSNFIRNFLKIKQPNAPNLFWKNGETYGRYLIDADKDLHEDIAMAFEKSIKKMETDYENSKEVGQNTK